MHKVVNASLYKPIWLYAITIPRIEATMSLRLKTETPNDHLAYIITMLLQKAHLSFYIPEIWSFAASLILILNSRV